MTLQCGRPWTQQWSCQLRAGPRSTRRPRLRWAASTAECTKPGARCTVVAKRVKRATTPTSAGARRQTCSKQRAFPMLRRCPAQVDRCSLEQGDGHPAVGASRRVSAKKGRESKELFFSPMFFFRNISPGHLYTGGSWMCLGGATGNAVAVLAGVSLSFCRKPGLRLQASWLATGRGHAEFARSSLNAGAVAASERQLTAAKLAAQRTPNSLCVTARKVVNALGRPHVEHFADTTIVSPLTSEGTARSLPRRRKEATYSELLGNDRCRLVALGIGAGGCWISEAAGFLRLLDQAKARAALAALQPCSLAALQPCSLAAALQPCSSLAAALLLAYVHRAQRRTHLCAKFDLRPISWT